MTTKRFIVQTLVLTLIVAAGFVIYHHVFVKKIAFINLSEVYNKFGYAKSLEKKAEEAITARSNIMDSLKFALESEYRHISSLPKAQQTQETILAFQAMKQDYLQKKEQFEKSSTQMVDQYEKQIWEQINKYVEDYGKEHHLALIVGGNGQGNIMYSDPSNDHTADVVAYINSKFQGN